MPNPEYRRWAHTGDGAYMLPRLRLLWDVQAEAERQAWDKAKRGGKAQHHLDDGSEWRTLGETVAYRRDQDGVYRLVGAA